MKILTQTVNGEDVIFSGKFIKGNRDEWRKNMLGKSHTDLIPDKTNIVISSKNVEIEIGVLELGRILKALAPDDGGLGL